MKNLKNLGKTLSKNEQKSINGGLGLILPEFDFCEQGSLEGRACSVDGNCCPGETCQRNLAYLHDPMHNSEFICFAG